MIHDLVTHSFYTYKGSESFILEILTKILVKLYNLFSDVERPFSLVSLVKKRLKIEVYMDHDRTV